LSLLFVEDGGRVHAGGLAPVVSAFLTSPPGLHRQIAVVIFSEMKPVFTSAVMLAKTFAILTFVPTILLCMCA
jgi:hypothetical protein